jgi:hypothetical protein
MSAAYAFVQHLAELAPIFTAPPGGAEFTRPQDWQQTTLDGNAERIGRYKPGDAICAVMGGPVTTVDVDPRNGGDVQAVRQLLDALSVRVLAENATPGDGRHLFIAGHPDLASCHQLTGYPGVDICSYGTNVFLPGTKRPKYNGKGYTVVFDNLEALAAGGDPDGAEIFAAWVADNRVSQRESFEPSKPWDGTPPDRRQLAYLDAMLRNRYDRIAAMKPDSGRNTAIYNAGLACGNFIAGAGLDETKAIDNLLDAANHCGLIADDGKQSVLASIRSGIKNGRARPRAVPERPLPDLGALVGDADPLDALLDHVRAWHELDDLAHVLFALACAVSAYDQGEPLWGMIVGAPSSGKTETVRMLDAVVDGRLDELTAAGLLSWSRGRTPKAVGILSRVGTRALVTVGDFSTVLAMSDHGARDMLFALLRRAYDGSVTRDLGNAPAPLRWQGRLTVLTAVTPVIDNYTAHADALGPRWLYLRMPGQSVAKRRRAASRENRGALEDNRAKARALAAAIVDQGRDRLPSISLDQPTREALADVAVVACAGRGAVPREGYGRREIKGMAVVEEPHRLVAQLHALTRGALALGVDEADAIQLARRAVLDTVPHARLAVLQVLSAGEALTVAQVGERAGLHRQVARMALEDLREVRLTCCPVEDNADVDDVRDLGNQRRDWQLTPELGTLAAGVLAEQRRSRKADTKSRYPPPNPPKQEEETREDVDVEPTFRVDPDTPADLLTCDSDDVELDRALHLVTWHLDATVIEKAT